MLIKDIPLARRDIIADRLEKGSAVVASTLAIEFSVSEDAIRRDLRALSAEGLCRRVYGGALPLSSATAPMAVRMTEGQERKAVLARTAAADIRRGEMIFIDSGSTNLAITEFLPEEYELTVVTNSLAIASALLPRDDIRVVVLGGEINHQVGGSVDGIALLSLTQMTFDRAFIGACALSVETGVCAFDMADAVFKRQLIASSERRVVLVTNEKLSLDAPHRIATLQQLSQIIVEPDLPDSELEILSQSSLLVVRATR